MIENALEFDKIKAIAAGFTHSSAAREKLLALTPESDFDRARELLAQTETADAILYEYGVSPAFGINDSGGILKKASKASILSVAEITAIGANLHIAFKLAENINSIPDGQALEFKSRTERIYIDNSLVRDIEKSFSSDNGVSDAASPILKEIRSSIRLLNEKIKTKLNSFISDSTFQKYLQDNIVTLRNNRYVLPVKSEYKSAVKGLVHDVSASGATAYVEPLAIVELNNELKEAAIAEEREIENILREFTLKIAEIADKLRGNDDIISDFDVIFSKAKYARDIKAVKPLLNNQGIIDIREGRHPLLPKNTVVPVSVALGENFDILLVTGPNTGGKTVTLKMTGLFCAMAMCGMFLPCEPGSRVSVFSRIFADVGDEQSIEQNLSTFSAHVKKLIEITDNIDSESLALIDELGAGTDPEEGSALARSVLEYILKSGAKAVVTTHYGELKEYSFKTDRIENASMGFDNETLRPTYRLLSGVAGSSNALIISRRLGLKEEIAENAERLISSEKRDFERVLRQAEDTRRDAERVKEEIRGERTEAARLRAEAEKDRQFIKIQREKLENDMKKQAKLLLADYTEEAQEILGEMKRLLSEPDESGLFEARRLNKKLKSFEYDEKKPDLRRFEDSPVEVGDEVFISGLGASARVVAINEKKDEITVKAGTITSIIKKSEIRKIGAGKSAGSAANVTYRRDLSAAVTSEVNLIGKNVDEAIYEMDEFLDKSLSAGLEQVRIVHGKGKGILRKALQRRLSENPAVAEYRDGVYGEGENGVTIVKFK